MNQMQQAALDYLRRGYSVIPVGRNKRPLLTSWKEFMERPPSEEVIRKWFSNRQANIAIVTGSVSGDLAVLDIDHQEAAEALIPLFEDRAPLVRTPRGGLHIYLREQARSRSRPVQPGVADLKAEGGYVLAPPSRTDRGSYVSINELSKPHFVSDAWAFAAGAFRSNVQRPDSARVEPEQTSWLIAALNGAAKGERNDMAARIAGHLRHENVPLEVARFLIQVYSERCQPPFPQGEAEQVLKGVYGRYAPGRSSPAMTVEEPDREFSLIPASSLISRPQTPRRWVIENLLPVGGTLLIAAEAGASKSWLGLHLVRSVASGHRLLGRLATDTGPAIYVDEEMGQDELQRRLAALASAQPGADDQVHVSYLAGLRLSSPAWVSRLEQEIARLRPKVVVLDTLRAVYAGDENSSQEMRGLFNVLRTLRRDYACAFVLLHHKRKQGANGDSLHLIRGSSDIAAAVDSILTIQRKDGAFLLRHVKSRTGPQLEPLSLSLVDTDGGGVVLAVRDSDDTSQESGTSKRRLAEQTVLDELQGGPRSRGHLEEQVKAEGIAARTFAAALDGLLGEGMIQREQHGREAVFQLVKPAPDEGIKAPPPTPDDLVDY